MAHLHSSFRSRKVSQVTILLPQFSAWNTRFMPLVPLSNDLLAHGAWGNVSVLLLKLDPWSVNTSGSKVKSLILNKQKQFSAERLCPGFPKLSKLFGLLCCFVYFQWSQNFGRWVWEQPNLDFSEQMRASWLRDRTQVSCIAGRFTIWATREAQESDKSHQIFYFLHKQNPLLKMQI